MPTIDPSKVIQADEDIPPVDFRTADRAKLQALADHYAELEKRPNDLTLEQFLLLQPLYQKNRGGLSDFEIDRRTRLFQQWIDPYKPILVRHPDNRTELFTLPPMVVPLASMENTTRAAIASAIHQKQGDDAGKWKPTAESVAPYYQLIADAQVSTENMESIRRARAICEQIARDNHQANIDSGAVEPGTNAAPPPPPVAVGGHEETIDFS